MAKGTLALRRIQLGDNADTSKNFVISVPAVADGTLTIERENGADVLTIDASGKVVIPGNVQTWQDVKSSRALGTTYTNNTSLPISIHVVIQNTTASVYFTIAVNGLLLTSPSIANANYLTSLTVTVPAGATYVVSSTGTPTLNTWLELR